MDIRQYLKSKHLEWKEAKRPAGLQALFPCPSCNQDEFAISLETGAYKCFRENNCGIKGSWIEFQRIYGDNPKQLIDDNYFKYRKKEYKRPAVKSNPIDDKVKLWLRSRGFREDIVKQFKIGYDGKGAVMFPYFKDGILVGIKYRSIAEKKFWKEKDCEPVLYNRDNVDGNDLIICEGESDCIAMTHYMGNAVSLPSGVQDTSWIENEWEWLEQFQRIYLVFDMDRAGQDGLYKIADRLGKWRCYKVKLPYKDINECLLKDFTKNDMNSCVLNADEFKLHNLHSADYYTEQLKKYNENKELLYGTKTGFEGLDKIIKGWRDEELTVWTGRNGTGKSTILNQIIINLVKSKKKCCIISLELTPKKFLRWMIMQISGKENITNEDIDTAMDLIGKDLYIINVYGQIKKDDLMNIFDFAARKYGINHYFIDSLMRISFPGSDEYKQQKEFVSDLVTFTKEHKSHVHLVAHPRKGQKDSYRPDKVDISGTGDITNLADNVLIMWRADEEEKGSGAPDSILVVKKNREWGTEGKVKFSFDDSCKLFNEIADNNLEKKYKSLDWTHD